MEDGIARVVKLAKLSGKKKVMLNFSSRGLCKIFLGNLHTAFYEHNVQLPVNIEARFVIRKERNNE